MRMIALLSIFLQVTRMVGTDGSESNKNFRMSRTPSDRERVGFVPHFDSSVLTLIAQSNKQGIELCPPSGRWHRPRFSLDRYWCMGDNNVIGQT